MRKHFNSCAPKGNGLDAANDQPAKTLSKRTADFIAAAARYAIVNGGFNILFLVLASQFVAIVCGAL
jgi:hypothetical protein